MKIIHTGKPPPASWRWWHNAVVHCRKCHTVLRPEPGDAQSDWGRKVTIVCPVCSEYLDLTRPAVDFYTA